MVVADNNAGIIADVSYAIPDCIEFNLPYYWQFYVWVTKGTIKFSVDEKESFYYIAGENQGFLLEEECKIDYLTDFYNLLKGKCDIVLPAADSISVTRNALEIQNHSL